MLRVCMPGYACFFVRTVAREHEVVGMFGYACFIEACVFFISCCRSTVGMLLHCLLPLNGLVVAALSSSPFHCCGS